MGTRQRRLIGLGLLVIAASTLLACTASASAGTVGGAVGVLLVIGALVFGAGTQSGCDDTRSVKGDAGPDIRVGPCLSLPPPDGALDTRGDIYVGPCLSPPLRDAGLDGQTDRGQIDQGLDLRIGPCLSLPPPDAAIDTATPDTATKRDLLIGPCLSLPPRDATSRLDDSVFPSRRDGDSAEPTTPEPTTPEQRRAARRDVVEKLAANLPADVLERLRRDTNKS